MKKLALILAVLIALGCPGLALAQPDTDTIARYGRILAGLKGENVDDGATSTINAGAFSSGSDLLEAGVGTDENLSTGVQGKPSPAAPNFGNLTGSMASDDRLSGMLGKLPGESTPAASGSLSGSMVSNERVGGSLDKYTGKSAPAASGSGWVSDILSKMPG